MSDDIILPSKKVLYANCGIVGIDDEGHITQGYDGNLATKDFEEEYLELSDDDLNYIANLMIERWTFFKNNIQKLKDGDNG